MDIKAVMELVQEHHVLQIMLELGADISEPSGSMIWFKTICHNGKKDKLCYFRDSKHFHCYTECGNLSLIDLIMQVKEVDFKEAKRYLLSIMGVENRQIGLQMESAYDIKERRKTEKYAVLRSRKKEGKTRLRVEHLQAISNPQILNYFDKHMFYRGWINEGISIKTMIAFGISWYHVGNSIVIPHHNMYGEVVGIRRRSLEEDSDYKYMPITVEDKNYTHSLNLNFYGLHIFLEAIKKYKKVIIVESEKSVLLAYEFYGEDTYVLATCGFIISSWHIMLLKILKVEEVTLAFDKDFDLTELDDMDEEDERNEYYKKIIRYKKRLDGLTGKLAPHFRTYQMVDRLQLFDIKDAPYDKGKEVFETSFKDRTFIDIKIDDTK